MSGHKKYEIGSIGEILFYNFSIHRFIILT